MRAAREWTNLVEKILDLNKAEVCPFEMLTAGTSDPKEAYERAKEQIETKTSEKPWKKR